ncbi:MAG TPA: hypothetical protein VJQ82_11205 [Terriglobales bacterium]|nr:hypothetical protein [Terriglobales bacterium]
MMGNVPFRLCCLATLPLLIATASAQGAQNAPAQVSAPVSYASVSQLNVMLSQLEQASQATQADLSKTRVEKWKTDSNSKKQSLANVDSIQRNLQNALPEMIAALRANPEDLAATFKVYRNLDALYDVFGSLVESAGAFGSKDEFQALDNDLSSLERSRRSFADRMDSLSTAKESELTRLHAEVQKLQAAVPATPPKKVIVDDNEPPKKAPAKKKPKKTAPPQSAPTPPQ